MLRPHDLGAIAEFFINWKKFGNAFEQPLNVNSLMASLVWLYVLFRYGNNLVASVI